MFNVLRFETESVWNLFKNDYLLLEKRSYRV